MLAALLLLVAAVPTWASDAGEPEQATAEQIQRWVADLGAAQYHVRDVATRRLIAAGSAAVGPVSAALKGNGLEVTTRGIVILQELALSGDVATESAARDSLEKIARLRLTSAARRAQEALAKLDDQRQDRAIAHLKRLGARFIDHHAEMGLRADSIRLVEIGDTWRGTDQDLARLAWLRDIEQVTFLGSRVKKEWVRHIAEMPNLSIVKIKHADIDNETLAALPQVANLQYVKLLYVPVDNECLVHLRNCRKLSKLMLFGTKVTREQAAALEQGVLGEVDFRNGAFLGIQPSFGPNWSIQVVTPGSAAEKAGLMPHDVIVKYQGQPVGDFDSLTELISRDEAGDTVTMVIRRGGELLSVEVTLGEWD